MTRPVSCGVLVLVSACGGVTEDTDRRSASAAAATEADLLVQMGGEGATCSTVLAYQCADDARGASIAPLPNGGAIVGGSFAGTLRVGPHTLTSASCTLNCPKGHPSTDVFVARLEPDGSVAWVQHFGGSDNDWLYRVVADSKGRSWATGTFSLPMDIGAHRLTTRGSADVWIASLDATGQVNWATSGGSTTYDYPHALVHDGSAVWIAGSASGAPTFSSVSLASAGGYDAFVVSFNAASGTATWGASAGGPAHDFGRGLAVDHQGRLLVTGSFSGTASLFGSVHTAAGLTDGFAASVDSGGSAEWVRTVGGSGADVVEAVATRPGGVTLVAGEFADSAVLGSTALVSHGGQDAFVARLDQTGAVAWARSAGGAGSDRFRGIDLQPQGDATVVGQMSETATLGKLSVSAVGGHDALIARVDRHGTFTWARVVGGAGDDLAQAVATQATDRLFVAGTTRGSAWFPDGLHSSSSVADAFFWRFRVK